MTRLLVLWAVLLTAFVATPCLRAAEKASHFVFAKIQDKVDPTQRAIKYEEPLDDALVKAKLGKVTGGGSLLNNGAIEWVGVDIELINLTGALEFTRKKLRQLGAPKGSVLEFRQDGKDVVLPVHER